MRIAFCLREMHRNRFFHPLHVAVRAFDFLDRHDGADDFRRFRSRHAPVLRDLKRQLRIVREHGPFFRDAVCPAFDRERIAPGIMRI